MEFNVAGILVIISSSLLFSPLALCGRAPAPAPSFALEPSSPAPSPLLSTSSSLFTPFSSSLLTTNSLSNSLFAETKPAQFDELPNLKDIKPLDEANLGAIKKVCSVTEEPEDCFKTILPNLKGAVDPVNVLQTLIQKFVNLTETVMVEIKASMDNPSTGSTVSECLKVCIDNYAAAYANLKQALDAISSHNMGLLSSVLSGAITELETCNDTFDESGETLPLDKGVVATLHKLATNCMDIAEVLLV